MHDLALDSRRFVLQPLAQRLQFGDEVIDLLHRGAGEPLQQRVDIAGRQVAAVFQPVARCR